MEVKKQYRIFYKDKTTKGRFIPCGETYKTFDDAKEQVAMLVEEDKQAKGKGFYQSEVAGFGITMEYTGTQTEYKIFERLCSPWQMVEEQEE